MAGLGERIRQARLRAGLTQAQLARTINTSERNISRWEKDQNRPRIEHINAIAEATGTDVRDLMNGDAVEPSSDDDEEADPMADLMRAIQRLVRAEVQAVKA